MAKQYVEKIFKVKGEVRTTKYRVDPDFKPTDISEICVEFIENFCVAKDAIAWLVDKVNTTSYEVVRKNKETGESYTETVKCDNYPFVNLRRDFAQEFFPDIIKGKVARETFKDKINKLYSGK